MRRLSLTLGDSAPPLAAQLAAQGMELDDGGLHQRLATALVLLSTHRVLTRAEVRAGRGRLEARVRREARASQH